MLGNRCLITGGTGSLGTAILDKAEQEKWDTQFTVLSRDENKQSAIKSKYPNVKFVLGDIRDEEWLRINMRNHDTVIHCAAYKQVPSSQNNVGETIKSNVIGSLNVARAAVESDVKTVVGISTDKAAMPVQAYGSSKNMMEHAFVNANAWGNTKFTLTRYGNVLGSRGSVLEFFINQRDRGGPLTVTDKRMRRFWITLDQAVDLVVKAYNADHGVIVVPKAAQMSVWDMAQLIAHKHCNVIETVIRAGEKLDEMMITPAEAQYTTESNGFFYIHPYTSDPSGDFDYGYEYTTANAHRMPDDEMIFHIENWVQEHKKH